MGSTIVSSMSTVSFTLTPTPKKAMSTSTTASSMSIIPRLSTDSLTLKSARLRLVGLTSHTTVGMSVSAAPPSIIGRK